LAANILVALLRGADKTLLGLLAEHSI